MRTSPTCRQNINFWLIRSHVSQTSEITFFNWVSKVILGCFGFALLFIVIGPKKSRHLLNQSDAKLTKNHDLVESVFPRFSSHWLFRVLSSLLTGRCNYFGFGFTTLNRKAIEIQQTNIHKMHGAMYWIEIYLADSVIHALNNRGLATL